MLMRDSRMRLWRDENRNHCRVAGLHEFGNIKVATNEGTAHRAHSMAIHPYLRAVIYAAKMDPGMPSLVCSRHTHGRAVPITGLVKALRDPAHVLAVQRFGIDLVVYQGSQNRARHGGLVPILGMEMGCRHDRGFRADARDILHFPACYGLRRLRIRKRGDEKEQEKSEESIHKNLAGARPASVLPARIR